MHRQMMYPPPSLQCISGCGAAIQIGLVATYLCKLHHVCPAVHLAVAGIVNVALC